MNFFFDVWKVTLTWWNEGSYMLEMARNAAKQTDYKQCDVTTLTQSSQHHGGKDNTEKNAGQ